MYLIYVFILFELCLLFLNSCMNSCTYFLDWNARVLLVSSELLAGVVFEGAFYSRARSIPFSLSVTKFFSKHNNFKFKGFIIMLSFVYSAHYVRFIY